MVSKKPTCISIPLVAILLVACGGSGDKGQGVAPTAPTAEAMGKREAKLLFESLCSTCHGMSGHGDGPGAAALDPKPRTFADVAWQDSVTDDHIQKTIVYGGAAVGKSAIMPANPQLKGKNETLKALAEIVRSFRPK